jgi:ABC-2 type transport system ATP-binding protein
MISAIGLTKYYGDIKAVDGISFEIGSGEIIGFLGPNGAGKTTTMQMLTGYLAPTKGSANISGYDVWKNTMEVKKLIGYLPENNPLYPDMYVYDFLVFFAQLKGFVPSKIKEEIMKVSEICSIQDILGRKIEHLSKGYKQRVGLAQAILGDPEILILDEPTVGLDPNQIVEIRELIKSLGKEKTVILSTHILQEVEQTCNRVIVIHRGKIVKDAKLSELIGEHLEFVIETEPKLDKKFLTPFGKIIEEKGNSYTISTDKDIRRNISEICLSNKILILELTRRKKLLEDIFRELTMEEKIENA